MRGRTGSGRTGSSRAGRGATSTGPVRVSGRAPGVLRPGPRNSPCPARPPTRTGPPPRGLDASRRQSLPRPDGSHRGPGAGRPSVVSSPPSRATEPRAAESTRPRAVKAAAPVGPFVPDVSRPRRGAAAGRNPGNQASLDAILWVPFRADRVTPRPVRRGPSAGSRSRARASRRGPRRAARRGSPPGSGRPSARPPGSSRRRRGSG